MKEAIKSSVPPFQRQENGQGIRKQILSARLEIGGKIGWLCNEKARLLGLFPHLEVLDELLDLDPEIDAFDIVHAVVRVLFLQMSG